LRKIVIVKAISEGGDSKEGLDYLSIRYDEISKAQFVTILLS